MLTESALSQTTHSGLTQTGTFPSYTIKPIDNSLHSDYVFYIRVKYKDSLDNFLGYYEMYIGCTPNSVQFSDNSSLVTAAVVYIGSPTTARYFFSDSISNRDWCAI